MTLHHFYRANLSPQDLARAENEVERLFVDLPPEELAHYLLVSDGTAPRNGVAPYLAI